MKITLIKHKPANAFQQRNYQLALSRAKKVAEQTRQKLARIELSKVLKSITPYNK